MSKVDLYLNQLSQPSRSLEWFATLSGIEFTPHYIDITKGEQRSEDYLKINPVGKIPAAVIDGETHIESAAIARYLANINNKTAYYPTDAKTRFLIDQYLDYHHIGIRSPVCGHLLACYLGPTIFGTPVPSDETKAELSKKAGAAVDALDQLFLKGKDFIVGDTATIADLFAYGELSLYQMITHSIKNEKVLAYMERLKKVPKHDEIHGTAYATSAKIFPQ